MTNEELILQKLMVGETDPDTLKKTQKLLGK
jgi:hypothetical protein